MSFIGTSAFGLRMPIIKEGDDGVGYYVTDTEVSDHEIEFWDF